MCQKQFDNFSLTISGSSVKGSPLALEVLPVDVDLWMVPQETLDFIDTTILCCIIQLLLNRAHVERKKEGEKRKKGKERKKRKTVGLPSSFQCM